MLKINLPLFALFTVFFLQISAQTTEQKLSAGIGFDGEPNMVVNPVNSRHMVVAWMGLVVSGTGTLITIKTRTTFDGGKTWSSPVSLPHFSSKWTSADPTMAFHVGGKLYLAYIDSRKAVDSGAVYLFSSSNGGLAWNFESKVIDAQESVKIPVDRPWMVADNSGTSTDGTIYITTKPAPTIPPPNRPYLKVSTDGKNWSATRNVDTTGYLVGNFIQAPMAAPGVTANGKFMAMYPSYVVSQSVYPQMFLATSTSRGATFSYNAAIVNPINTGDTNIKSGYQLLPHPKDPKMMVFAGLEGRNGDADVFLYRSNNGGKNWNNGIRVNDDTIGNGKFQDLVWANWGKAGELAVCWRDRRNNAGKGFVQGSDCYCAVSTDSGKTFGKNIRMTANTASFNNILYQNGNDFMSCTLNGDTLVAVWGDVRSNKLEIWESSVAWKQNTNATQQLIVAEDLPAISLWPNPAKVILNYKIHVPVKESLLWIINSEGKIVKEMPLYIENKIDISTLPAGIYYLMAAGINGSFGEMFEVVK